MNNVQKGCQRDKDILRDIERLGVLTSAQVAALHFPFAYGDKKAAQRLKRLHDLKLLKRCYTSTDRSYAYYTSQKSGRLEHLIAVNWVYIHTLNGLQSWQTIYRWEDEKDYKFVRADAFFGLSNKFTGQVEYSFVEVDRSKNTFDKIVKYNDLYESNIWESESWVQTAKKFPSILCVCEEASRCRLVERLIASENRNGLTFKVYHLPEMISEVTARWIR